MEAEIKKVRQNSIKELRTLCQATAPNPARESKVGKFSRIFSIYFTKLFLYTTVPPPVVMTISVLVFFAGIALLAMNQYTINLIGVGVIFLSIVLDGTDGELARARKQTSVAAGMYGEPVSHDFQYGFGFILVAIGLHAQGAPSWILILGALAGISKLIYRLLEIRFWDVFHGHQTKQQLDDTKQSYHKLPLWQRFGYWVNKNFFSSTGVFLVALITVLADRLDLFVWFFAVGYTLLLIALFAKQLVSILHNHKI
jgi:phosphatidylglycerophosphate synthase